MLNIREGDGTYYGDQWAGGVHRNVFFHLQIFCNVAIYPTNVLIFVPSVQICVIDLLPSKYEHYKPALMWGGGDNLHKRSANFDPSFVF